MPDILVAGGNGSLDGLAASIMKFLDTKKNLNFLIFKEAETQ